ncbi:MAG TPA: xanthine dehydrogenase family protein molybdopterin-binding subunit [Baekduia sp.]
MSGTVATRGGAGRFVGARVQRREDPRLLTGHGRYVDDVQLPGMVHAAFVRSPVARGAIRAIDVSEAQALPGVVAVLTGRDGWPLLPPWWPSEGQMPQLRPLAVDDVRFVGDPVAVVIAASRAIAEDACELVDVDYDVLEPVVSYLTAGAPGAPLVHPEMASNIVSATASPPDPDLDAAFAAADHVFSETIRSHRCTQVPMETRGLVATWEPGAGEMTVHLSGQVPHAARAYFAAALGLPESSVRVILGDVGGGFGQKAFHGRDELAVVLAARRVGRPVKWIEDRQENLTAASHAREEQMTVDLAVSAEGVIQAARIDHLVDAGSYPLQPADGTPGLVVAWFCGPYRIPAYGFSTTQVYTNTCALGPYRGPWAIETTAREIMMDIVARGLDLDPAELRRRNVLQAADLPYALPTGIVFDHVTPAATLEQVLELGGYDALRARQRAARAEGRLLGLGLSGYIEPTAFGGGRAMGIEAATIRVEPSGGVTVLMGLGSHGQGSETTMAQVIADHLGVALSDVVVVQGDTRSAPVGGGNAGSRAAVVGGAVAQLAAVKVRDKVFAIVAHLLEASPDDLQIEDGVVSVKGSPDAAVALTEVARIAYDDASRLPDGMEPGLEETARYSAPFATHSNATHLCVCEVDPDTGMVKILDYTVSEDCGVMINPTVVEGQIAGGVVQGIGGVLLEHAAYDEAGNPLAANFKDYLMPVADLVPDLRYGHVETPSSTPGGHQGAGEGGTIGAIAAVFNAVADALAPLGVRLTEQPLSPSRLLALIEDARA